MPNGQDVGPCGCIDELSRYVSSTPSFLSPDYAHSTLPDARLSNNTGSSLELRHGRVYSNIRDDDILLADVVNSRENSSGDVGDGDVGAHCSGDG